jgi:hypothetical protein
MHRCKDSATRQERPIMNNQTQLIEQLASLLKRYRTETPPGHQPYLIAETVDSVLSDVRAYLEQLAEPPPVISYGMQSIHDAITDDPSLCEPAPSMAGDVPKIGCVQHDCAECQTRAALPVGELTDQIFEVMQGWSSATFGWQGSNDPEVEAANFAKGKLEHDKECKRRISVILAAAQAAPARVPLMDELVPACRDLIDFLDKNPPMGESIWAIQRIRKALRSVPAGPGDMAIYQEIAAHVITQGGKA